MAAVAMLCTHRFYAARSMSRIRFGITSMTINRTSCSISSAIWSEAKWLRILRSWTHQVNSSGLLTISRGILRNPTVLASFSTLQGRSALNKKSPALQLGRGFKFAPIVRTKGAELGSRPPCSTNVADNQGQRHTTAILPLSGVFVISVRVSVGSGGFGPQSAGVL